MELDKIILNGINNGGFTINSNFKPIQEKNGFIVSLYGYEKTYPCNGDYKALKSDILKYQSIIKKYKNLYIGLWIDNGLIYLDISKHYSSKKRAIQAGVQNEQIAIYDIAKNDSVYLTIDTYILYRFNAITNDIQYIKEFTNIKDLKDAVNVLNIYHYISESVDSIKHVLKDEFIIIKDRMLLSEL